MIGIQAGFRADTVSAYLAEAHRTATTRLGSTNPGDLGEYLTWAATHIRTLGPSIKPRDLDALLTTPTYWALLSLASTERVGLGVRNIIQVELNRRASALDIARNELQVAHLRSNGTHAGVLDTNVLMVLGARLQAYEWHDKLGVEKDRSLDIWIPLAVIDELDRLKRDRSPMSLNGKKVPRRDLARTALRGIDVMFPEPEAHYDDIVHGVRFRILMEEPGHVRLSSVDAEVIDQAVNLAALGGPVQVVTFDTGMRLKARAAEVLARQLPEPEDD